MRRLYKLLLLLCTSFTTQAAITTYPLWPANSEHVRPGPAAIVTAKGTVTRVNAPFLSLYSPTHFNGRTILIAAGGGYRRIEQAKEAIPAAKFLTHHGFRVYILTYRLPNARWPEGKDVAVVDVRQALKLLHASTPRLSVLGFSAGAHLLGVAINRADYTTIPVIDKPTIEGTALLYPIITLEAPANHSSTHRVLVGRTASPEDEKKWSVQTMITAHSPPLFVVETDDDPIAPPINGLLLNNAARSHHIPMEWIRYQKGGHGFGLGQTATPVSNWPNHYLHWLKHLVD